MSELSMGKMIAILLGVIVLVIAFVGLYFFGDKIIDWVKNMFSFG